MILANILRVLASSCIGWIISVNGITVTTGPFWIVVLCLAVIIFSSEYLGNNR